MALIKLRGQSCRNPFLEPLARAGESSLPGGIKIEGVARPGASFAGLWSALCQRGSMIKDRVL